MREDFIACANYLRTRPDCTGKIGAVGFCYGYIYAGTQHGFNNDTTPRYDAAAAKLAWERTIAHFNKYVRG